MKAKLTLSIAATLALLLFCVVVTVNSPRSLAGEALGGAGWRLAFAQALGDKVGIERFGAARIPMDEALADVALDISGRPFLVYRAEMPQERIGSYDSCMTVEFFRAFAFHGGITLHAAAEYGDNAHHMTEALFKALARALRAAVRITGDAIPSTKGAL